MKKRILSIALIVALIVSSVSILAACNNIDYDAFKKEVTNYVNDLKAANDYTAENATALQSKLDEFLGKIAEAKSKEEIAQIVADAKTALAGIEHVAKSYTLNDYTSASPNTWNVHTWQTNGDQVIMSYTEMGLVDVGMKTEGEYEFIYEMATAIEDITAQATAEEKEKWNITEDQTKGRMFKVTLNPLAKWQDGTPINADTYIDSMKLLLDSRMKNSRSDLYWSGENAVYNGEFYFKQDMVGQKSFGKLATYPGYTDTQALIDAGVEIYVDLAGFWGIPGVTDPILNTDDTMYRDPGVPEGNDEDYVSAKYIWDNYLKPGAPYASYSSDYCYYVTGVIPEVTWDQVGLYKTNDYEIVYVTANVQSMYNFLISGGSNWIVNKALYESTMEEKEGLLVTKYGTSVDNYLAYGPYKLVTFEKDKQFVLERNENWYGWKDGKHEGQFQTTKIKVEILTDRATILQKFLKGELDTVALEASDMETYGASDYLLKTPETYTMKFSFNTSLEVLKKLEAERNDGNNIEVLANTKFRKAMSWAFDRETWCKEVTAGEIPQVALLSDLYFYDVENDPTSVYRNSEIAMKGIVNYYGLEYGEGKTYATLKEAYRACTGYDIEQAKTLFREAYDEVIADGTYTAGQNIVINVGAAKASSTPELVAQEKKFNDFLKAGTEGTPFEGKVSVKYIYNINDRYGDCSTGVRECCYGGLGGAAFYPYRCFNSYIDEKQAVGGRITEGNFDAHAVNITITYDFNGDGEAETVTKDMFTWNASITAPQDGVPDSGIYFDAPHATRLTILSAIECAILNEAHCFPITVTATVSMYSQKIKYATLNYNIMYGYGGTRLMTYNYSDFEWANYVASQGGTLDYK